MMDHPVNIKRLMQIIPPRYSPGDKEKISGILKDLCRRNLALEDRGLYLALAVEKVDQ